MIYKEVVKDYLKNIEDTFGGKYTSGMASTIIGVCSRWSEKTMVSVVNHLKEHWRPSYGVTVPIAADFKQSLTEIHREDTKDWEKDVEPEGAVDTQCYQQYKREVSELMKKLSASDTFRLTDWHIDGVFACEICHRNCSGTTKEVLIKNKGCYGYLSEEKAKEIEELKKINDKN